MSRISLRESTTAMAARAKTRPILVGPLRIAQHRDAATGQAPGEVFEYFVRCDRRVLIQRRRSRDEHHNRKGSRAFRQG